MFYVMFMKYIYQCDHGSLVPREVKFLLVLKSILPTTKPFQAKVGKPKMINDPASALG
jgi:hypothetical protein